MSGNVKFRSSKKDSLLNTQPSAEYRGGECIRSRANLCLE